MSICPALSAGAAGGQPDVNAINAAFATIRSILNGDIDAANIENGAVALAKLASSIRVPVPVDLLGLGPIYTNAFGADNYAINLVDNYQNDIAVKEMLYDATIVAVQYRRFSMFNAAENFEAKLFIDGLFADPVTGAQAATLGSPVPLLTGDPLVISGLNIALTAGQKLSLRVNIAGAGVMDAKYLPIECVVWMKFGLL